MVQCCGGSCADQREVSLRTFELFSFEWCRVEQINIKGRQTKCNTPTKHFVCVLQLVSKLVLGVAPQKSTRADDLSFGPSLVFPI